MLYQIWRKVYLKTDNIMFNGQLEMARERNIIKREQKKNATSFEVFCDNTHTNPLAKLCDQYGSDKGEVDPHNKPYTWPSHNYTDLYHFLFLPIRYSVAYVFECGIGTNNAELKSSMGINGKPGASLRVWRDYFPNALIYGADVDREILFEENRIKTYYCDQTSKKSIEECAAEAKIKNKSLDVIIDDGLHEFHAGKSLFEGMKKYLSSTGIYVIEDVYNNDKVEYIKYFEKVSNDYDVYFLNLYRNSACLGDNSLIVIRPKG